MLLLYASAINYLPSFVALFTLALPKWVSLEFLFNLPSFFACCFSVIPVFHWEHYALPLPIVGLQLSGFTVGLEQFLQALRIQISHEVFSSKSPADAPSQASNRSYPLSSSRSFTLRAAEALLQIQILKHTASLASVNWMQKFLKLRPWGVIFILLFTIEQRALRATATKLNF